MSGETSLVDVEKQQEQDAPEETSAQPSKEADSDLEVLDDDEDPKKFSSHRKWIVVMLISLSVLCVTCCSSIVRFYGASSLHVSLRKGFDCIGSIHADLCSGRVSDITYCRRTVDISVRSWSVTWPIAGRTSVGSVWSKSSLQS